MGTLSNLEPSRVFHYFEEITKIPHGSYNVDMISDYLASWGKAHSLETYQDDLKNVIIIKEASEGYEQEPPIILQGHMDMVAVHKPSCNIDMKTEGLTVAVNEAGDYIYAENTSLGGDDGIAIAYALAILEDDTIKHPRLEVIFTTNEETGMEGAAGIDLSMLKGNRLLNLDSEDEGIFLAGCAGGLRVNATVPVWKEPVFGHRFTAQIGGLLGGHSGNEIDKERANSNKLVARFLYMLMEAEGGSVYLTYIDGGEADNAIPRETRFQVIAKNPDTFERVAKKFTEEVSNELKTKDPGFCFKYSLKDITQIDAYECSDAIRFLYTVPNGIQGTSKEIEGLVETSLNLGIITLVPGNSSEIKATFSVRSSIESAKDELANRVACIAKMAGGKADFHGAYPAWSYRSDSVLREKMIKLYEDMYGKKPEVTVIHAGLECGLLGQKIKDLDCVSIGPDMKDIHTTEEKLSISSTKRVYDYVCALLSLKD